MINKFKFSISDFGRLSVDISGNNSVMQNCWQWNESASFSVSIINILLTPLCTYHPLLVSSITAIEIIERMSDIFFSKRSCKILNNHLGVTYVQNLKIAVYTPTVSRNYSHNSSVCTWIILYFACCLGKFVHFTRVGRGRGCRLNEEKTILTNLYSRRFGTYRINSHKTFRGEING